MYGEHIHFTRSVNSYIGQGICMVKPFVSELSPILLYAICGRIYFLTFFRKRKVIEFSRNKEIGDRKFINF